jgi:hypothetical protein
MGYIALGVFMAWRAAKLGRKLERTVASNPNGEHVNHQNRERIEQQV